MTIIANVRLRQNSGELGTLKIPSCFVLLTVVRYFDENQTASIVGNRMNVTTTIYLWQHEFSGSTGSGSLYT
jgi:hypothetical protein